MTKLKHPVATHLIGGFEGRRITPLVKRLIQDYKIGGFILFKRNIGSVKQTKNLIQHLKDLADYPLFIGVDQEGGNVFRLGEPFTQIPPMANVGHYYQKRKKLKRVKAIGEILGREISAVGFNWDFAPVVDVHSNPKNPIIGKRAFSPDPEVVTACAKAVIKGLHEVGVLSCIKHFPGHGATDLDSHKTLPVLTSPGRLLWKRDMYPYRKLIPEKIVETIMTAHILYPELDEENCATLSKKILTDLLRKRLNFKGLICSDDLWMQGISDHYSIEEASYRFFKAGGDLALICHNPKSQLETIEYLNKRLETDKSLLKLLNQSQKRIERIWKRYISKHQTADLKIIGSVAHKDQVQIFKAFEK